MSYLKKDEQIHVKSVEELKAVHKALEREWNKEYSLDEEIAYFNKSADYRYVKLIEYGACLGYISDKRTTITFDEFMARVDGCEQPSVSYLKKDEQIYIKNVEQLKAVYEVLKEHWYEYYCLPEEMKYLNNHVGYCFVNWSKKEWGEKGIALFKQDNNATTITYEEFMARVNTNTRIPKDFDATKCFASCTPQQEITDEMLSVFKVGLNMLKIDMPKSMMEKIMLFSKEVTEKGGDVTLMDVAKIEAKINDKYKDDDNI